MPELKMPEGNYLPSACLTCALYGSNPGFESVRRVTLECGIKSPKNLCDLSPPPPTSKFLSWSGVASTAMCVRVALSAFQQCRSFLNDGVIKRYFYPVLPPDKNVVEVITVWLAICDNNTPNEVYYQAFHQAAW